MQHRVAKERGENAVHLDVVLVHAGVLRHGKVVPVQRIRHVLAVMNACKCAVPSDNTLHQRTGYVLPKDREFTRWEMLNCDFVKSTRS